MLLLIRPQLNSWHLCYSYLLGIQDLVEEETIQEGLLDSKAVVALFTIVGNGLIGGGVNPDFKYLDVRVCNTSADFLFLVLSEEAAIELESDDSIVST